MPISECRDSSPAAAHSSFTRMTVLQVYDYRTAQENKAQLLCNLLHHHLFYKKVMSDWIYTKETISSQLLRIETEQHTSVL